MTQAFALALDEARSTRSYDEFGRLSLALTPISKAGVSPYKGSEIPDWRALGLDPDKTYMMLRPPDELKRAASSFNRLPVLSRHQPVSAEQHRRDLTIGTTGDQAVYRHPFLMNTLSLWDRDQDAIGGVEDGSKRALSCGYAYRAVMEPGTYQGVHFDGRMVGISGNHLVTTRVGRVDGAVIGDSMPTSQEADMANLSPNYANPDPDDDDEGAAPQSPVGEIGPIERVRSYLKTVLNPQQMARLEQLISEIDKGAGGEPPPDVALQAGGTEARGQPSSSGFDRRPGMGKDSPRAFRGMPRPGGGMAGDSATREIEAFFGFRLPASGGTSGVPAHRETRASARARRMAYDSGGYRDNTPSIKDVTGVDLGRIRVAG